MSGMVMMLPTVVMNVISVMSEGLRPYFRQNIVPKLATGIAITTVLMLLTKSLTPHTLNRKYMLRGTTHKAQKRGNIYLRTADNLLHRQLCHRGTDNHQGRRYRDIAHHRYRTRNDIRRMYPESYQEGGNEGTKKSRRKQYLRIELLDAVLALDEHDTCRKNKRCSAC